EGYGRIYRIVPRDRELASPQINLETMKGQIQALLSPAVNVRNQGFERLKSQGADALQKVKGVLESTNPFHRARAVWLLSNLGEQGIRDAETLLRDGDPHIRITALRALRQTKPQDIITYARQMVRDESPAVRREVAIALKDLSFEDSKPLVLTLVD